MPWLAAFIAAPVVADPALVYDFTLSQGNSPSALVQSGDGNLYGTTQSGGSGYGTVFKLSPSGSLTTLYRFNGIDGWSPDGLVQGADGNFYGTTAGGGMDSSVDNDGYGTLFKITSSGTLTTLYAFQSADGAFPTGLILADGGHFVGTTVNGGSNALGTVFNISPSGVFSKLHDFDDSSYPNGGLVQLGNAFYGTTAYGGTGSGGTIFRITTSGTFTTLHSFGLDAEGFFPLAGLTLANDGNFYGSTSSGTSSGTLFQLTPGGSFSSLASFQSVTSSAGNAVTAPLVQGGDGNLYGMDTLGGSNEDGALFKSTTGGVITGLKSFTTMTCCGPLSGTSANSFILGGDGNFYGTTSGSGAYPPSGQGGTVFKLTPAGHYSILHAFYADSGAYPYAGLLVGSDGNFYGTAQAGGSNNFGTVFRLTPGGALTTLASFTGKNGKFPYASLMQADDGNYYGTTQSGGANGKGTVFQVTPGGTLTTLYSFVGSDGAKPECNLIQGSDGKLYGTTETGGSANLGTVFSITTGGVLATLHSFAGTDGELPFGGLIEVGGNFYGTTSQGSVTGQYGTVFKITAAGTLTTLHVFGGRYAMDGARPYASLVLGADGLLYGTTHQGGTNSSINKGTVFKISTAGAFTVVTNFVPGAYHPRAGLILASDGNFYGTTTYNEHGNYGSIYRMQPNGNLSVLYESTYGVSWIYGGLAQGTDGKLYATVPQGGSQASGAVISLPLP